MKNHVVRYESMQDPLDDEERELMDPENWDWENAYEVEPGPDPHLTFQVRLSGEDLNQIERAATDKGLTITAYLRYAALQCSLQRVPR
jgi:hypothetical protein